MVGVPSIVFTRKAVVNETFIRNSGNVFKTIVDIDPSQLYPYSMCQPMPTGLYTRWEDDTESNAVNPFVVMTPILTNTNSAAKV